MKGTTLQKLCRVVGSLAAHPLYLRRYIVRGPFSRSSPLDLELPWFSETAIDFLRSYLRPHMKVFEWGAGGSTIFFARRTTEVVSVEDSMKYRDIVSNRCQSLSLKNVDVRYRPFDFVDPVGFETSDYLLTLDRRDFDVIVVDGTEFDAPVRPRCFFRAEQFIKKGGIIVVDDSWRYPDIISAAKAVRHKSFKCIGPCRPGVTSTDVFFY